MSLVTKNPFAYLGNDSDGEEKPVVPVKTVDKINPRTTKRNVEPEAPTRGAGAGGNRRGASGNEGAFRDRGAGADRNHARSTEERTRDGPRGGSGARVRGGRGARSRREFDDRNPVRREGHGGSDKQAAASWGANEGNAELKDEQAADAIAATEKKDAIAEEAAPEEPAEPEDKSVSYTDYLAQLAEKKLGFNTDLKIRGANEGSKVDKKWANAKPLENEEEDYFAASGGKARREREKKVKQTIDFDPRYVEPERTRGGRGGSSRGSGGRGGRGSERGGERGGDRGGDRGGERVARGNFRGGRGGSATINTSDKNAFPSLGGK